MVCAGCGQDKFADGFYPDRSSRSGFCRLCKACTKARHSTPEFMAKTRERVRQWRILNPRIPKPRVTRARVTLDPAVARQRYLARGILRKAVQDNRIVKPGVCSDCGSATERMELHGHHEDYSKPLEVAWLCRKCHNRRSL